MYLPLAILSTPNLLHNLKVIKNTAPNSKIMVMLKANAYGHGIRSTGIRLDGLVEYFGVARLDEVMMLRKAGIKTTICIMQGVFTKEAMLTAVSHDAEVVVHNYMQLHCFDIVVMPKKINVWLKVNTGIGRIGFQPEEVYGVLEKLRSYSSIGTITLMSHFACADEKKHPLNNEQITIFKRLAADFPGPKSFANSAAIFNFPNTHYDIVRPGIAIYGISPLKNIICDELSLKPVMTLLGQIMSIHNRPSNSTIGYGARFTTKDQMLIATVGIGYGDGYPRTAIDGTPVLVGGIICPIIGRISMDMMTVDINSCNNMQIGDIITLWGEKLPLEVVSRFTKNITYDILTGIQLRVTFNWIK